MDNITNTEWLDDATFLVNFESKPITEDGEEYLVEVVAEWHEDENKWVYERQWYNMDGDYLDHEDLEKCLTPYEQAMYHTMAEGALEDYYKANNGSSSAWEEIVVADDYEKYDALMEAIKDYYASADDDKACEVEDYCNMKFMQLLHELDKKFKK